jgi:hypothetical protein
MHFKRKTLITCIVMSMLKKIDETADDSCFVILAESASYIFTPLFRYLAAKNIGRDHSGFFPT